MVQTILMLSFLAMAFAGFGHFTDIIDDDQLITYALIFAIVSFTFGFVILIINKIIQSKILKLRIEYMAQLEILSHKSEDFSETFFEGNLIFLRVLNNITRDLFCKQTSLTYEFVSALEGVKITIFADIRNIAQISVYLTNDVLREYNEHLSKITKLRVMKRFKFDLLKLENNIVTLPKIDKIASYYNIKREDLIFTDLRLVDNKKYAPINHDIKPSNIKPSTPKETVILDETKETKNSYVAPEPEVKKNIFVPASNSYNNRVDNNIIDTEEK